MKNREPINKYDIIKIHKMLKNQLSIEKNQKPIDGKIRFIEKKVA